MSVRHWETYYRSGALASCPLGGGAGCTLELRDAWVRFFSALDDGARVLDIGTGNGIVALIAKETAGRLGRSFEIHGTDLAQIDPARDVADGARLFAGIRFHGHVPTEQLPFEAGHFDAVSGQYSLEYADAARALAEIHRVLKPGGCAQFVVHHAGSIVTLRARESLAQTALVLEQTRVLRKLRRHFAAQRQSQQAARRTWDALSAAVKTLQAAMAGTGNRLVLEVTIDAVQKLLDASRQLGTAELDREVDRFEADVRASLHRIQDQIRTGHTESGIRKLAQLMQAQGFRIAEVTEQLHDGDKLVGWRLGIARP